MCSGGRIVNYLKALLADARTAILLTGYQAQGTPGRVIQQYGTGGYVLLDDKKYSIAANVISLSGYSAHADQGNLFNFVKRMRCKPRQIRLVHGDNQAKKSLQNLFKSAYPKMDVMIPSQ
jgi:metallo-beta-lactamase family protein